MRYEERVKKYNDIVGLFEFCTEDILDFIIGGLEQDESYFDTRSNYDESFEYIRERLYIFAMEVLKEMK